MENNNLESIRKQIDSSGTFTDSLGNMYKNISTFENVDFDKLKNTNIYGTEADALANNKEVSMNFDYIDKDNMFADTRGRIYTLVDGAVVAIGWINLEDFENVIVRTNADVAKDTASAVINNGYSAGAGVVLKDGIQPEDFESKSPADEIKFSAGAGDILKDGIQPEDLETVKFSAGAGDVLDDVGIKPEDLTKNNEVIEESSNDEGLMGFLKSTGATLAVAIGSIFAAPSDHEKFIADSMSRGDKVFYYTGEDDRTFIKVDDNLARARTGDELDEYASNNFDKFCEEHGLKDYCFNYVGVKSIFWNVKKFTDEPWKMMPSMPSIGPVPEGIEMSNPAIEMNNNLGIGTGGASVAPASQIEGNVLNAIEGGIESNPAASGVINMGGPSNVIDAEVVGDRAYDVLDSIGTMLK